MNQNNYLAIKIILNVCSWLWSKMKTVKKTWIYFKLSVSIHFLKTKKQKSSSCRSRRNCSEKLQNCLINQCDDNKMAIITWTINCLLTA